MTRKGCGVIYATTAADHDIEAAFLSAESVKRFCPDISVTLFAARADHPLCRASCFDHVPAIPAASDIRSGWNYLRCLAVSPYEFTLYLATDTRLLTPDLQGTFALLDTVDVAMVEAAPDISTLRRHLGGGVFDTGVILYRRNPGTAAWLSAWIELTEHNRMLATESPAPATGVVADILASDTRRELLGLDQTSLAEIMTARANRFGLAVQTLPYAWNDTGSR